MIDTSETHAQTEVAAFRPLPLSSETWQAFLLPVSAFPIPDEECRHLRLLLGDLFSRLKTEHHLKSEVFIQVMHLHWGGGTRRFADHARRWEPELGLGVWPDREPPRFWTVDDFQNLGPDDRPRTLMDQLFRIGAEEPLRADAVDTMLGLGSVVQLLARDEKAVAANVKEVLLSQISDPSYTCFPFYRPLFEAKSVCGATPEQLDLWSCGASVYMRESREDTGILLLTNLPLRHWFERVHARFHEHPTPEWRVSSSYVSFLGNSNR